MGEKLVSVSCRITRGGFSGERLIRVRTADGTSHTGVVPRHYCYHSDDGQIGKDEPALGNEIDGQLVARLVREENEQHFLVYLPDGEVITVEQKEISPFQGSSPHVPVES